MVDVQSMSKPRVALMLLALFLSSMCTLGDLVVTPIAANLFVVFADSPEWLINLGITGPAIVGLPFCFLTGWLCDRMDKRLLMIIGFALFTVSSICGTLIVNIYYFVALRLLATGVAWGITNSCAMAIIADAFVDEEKHGKMIGYYNMVMSLIGASLSMVAGILASSTTDPVNGMQIAFNTYWIAVPILVMLIAFLPKFPPHAVEEKKADGETASVPKDWWKRLPLFNVQIFVVALCYFAVYYMLSLYIVDAGVGNEAFTGTMASVMTISTAIGSLVFGNVYKKMKNAVCLPAIFVLGLGVLCLSYFPNPAVVTVCLAIMGFFWPFYFCYFYTHATEMVPPSKAGTATGIVALSDGLGAALCSYALIGLMGITGAESTMPVWPIFGFTLIITGIISTVWYVTKGRTLKSWSESQNVSSDGEKGIAVPAE